VQLPLQAIPQGDLFVAAQAIQSNAARWSSRLHPAATALPDQYEFFTTALGRPGGGAGFGYNLTRAETNMKLPGRLERPITLTVHRLIVSFIDLGLGSGSNDALQWLRSLLYESLIRLEVDETVLLEDHVLHWAGTGLTGTPTQGGGQGYISGNPALAGRNKLKIPIGIPSRMNFKVSLIFNSNSIVGAVSPDEVETFMRVYLEGNLSRSIDG